jgi:hypothetical protein
MAVTLTQSALYTQNKLHRGIIQTIIKTSPLMTRLPFANIEGNALAVNRESTLPSVGFRAPRAKWTESTGEISQATFGLKILGGDADVDKFMQKTRSNVTDLMKTQIKMKAKAMAHDFDKTCIYGNSTSTNEFDGLHVLIDALASTQQLHMGSSSTGAAMTIAKLDALVDAVPDGPDILLMNKTVRRRLSEYLRTVGSYVTERDEYGRYFMMWNDIPIVVTDWIYQTETISGGAYALPTTGACSSVFALKLGEGEGFCGIQNGGIETETFEQLEEYWAKRVRMAWIVGTALYSTVAVARLDGVTDAAVTA